MDAVEADRERFQRFAEFLEAVVAYSKAEGAR
jgi:CRISPR/Cas system CSM-associated protein Csm2 small subunit